MKNNKVAVVIPVNKINLEEYEIVSINQAVKVFSKRDIFFVIPHSLNNTFGYDVNYISIPDCYFGSVKAHNNLLISKFFYELFSDYEYLLLHHTDALVFKDDLDYFCDKYDYVGAPWLYGVEVNTWNGHKICFVGNGGLSLRKIDKFISVIERYGNEILKYDNNEDTFFSGLSDDDLVVAPICEAIKFSVEAEVELAYKLNDYQLPMGCHAWHKFNGSFWKKQLFEKETIIEKCNFNTDLDQKHAYDFQRFYLINKYDVFFETSNIQKILTDMLFKNKQNLIVWGAGNLGEIILDILLKCGLEPLYVLDSNEKKQLKTIKGHSIKKPSIDSINGKMVLVAIIDFDYTLFNQYNCKYISLCDISKMIAEEIYIDMKNKSNLKMYDAICVNENI